MYSFSSVLLLLSESIVRIIIYSFSNVLLLSESIVRIIIYSFSSLSLLTESNVRIISYSFSSSIVVVRIYRKDNNLWQRLSVHR